MKVTSLATFLASGLLTFLSLTSAGHTQPACQEIDETTPGGVTRQRGAVVVTPRALEEFQKASPEALRAFRELNVDPPTGRIVGGWPVFFENNPWQIAMIRANVAEPRRSQFCGGSIIANNWVLTAAHCVRNSIVRENPARVDVVAGSSQWAIGGERIKVAEIHTHPRYNQSTMDNDFALLRLQSSQTLGEVIKLADQNTQIDNGMITCVTGWGATFEGGPGSIDLVGAEMPVVSNDVCNRPESYGGDITNNMICAGRERPPTDACQGDSGGPMSTLIGGRPTLVGVVSWGEGCARRLKYGVYARVSAAAPWIASTMAGR